MENLLSRLFTAQFEDRQGAHTLVVESMLNEWNELYICTIDDREVRTIVFKEDEYVDHKEGSTLKAARIGAIIENFVESGQVL